VLSIKLSFLRISKSIRDVQRKRETGKAKLARFFGILSLVEVRRSA